MANLGGKNVASLGHPAGCVDSSSVEFEPAVGRIRRLLFKKLQMQQWITSRDFQITALELAALSPP